MFDSSVRLEDDDDDLDDDGADFPPVDASTGDYTYSALDARGVELWARVQRMHLPEQVRCRDPRHAGFAERLRAGDTTGLADYLREHRLKASDAREFCTAPVCSPGNPERLHLTQLMLSEFAANHGDRVISWRLPNHFTGLKTSIEESLSHAPGGIDAAELIYKQNPELTAHFVAGAPILLTSNMNPTRGLANGVPAELYSLQWPASVRDAALQWLDTHPGDVVLPRGLEPSAVLARLPLSDEARAVWRPALNLAARFDNSSTPSDAVPAEVVIPIETQTTSILVHSGGFDRKGKPKKTAVSVETPQYDFNFIGTCHKAQGKTLSKVIISLLNRPGKPSRKGKGGFHALYVCLTRVCDGKDFRVILEDNPRDVNFVDSLRPPKALLAYLKGFDADGFWNKERALEEFTRLGGRIIPQSQPQTRAVTSVRIARAKAVALAGLKRRERGSPARSLRMATLSTSRTATTHANKKRRTAGSPARSLSANIPATAHPHLTTASTAALPPPPTLAASRSHRHEQEAVSNLSPRDLDEHVKNAVHALTNSEDKIITAVAKAREEIGDWHPLVAHPRAPLSLAEAQAITSGIGPAGPARQHSAFFVPFLRAAQGLAHSNIGFLRDIVGPANWDAAVTRTAAVFRAVGITPELTRWRNDYVGEHAQEAMLSIESALLDLWKHPDEPSSITGGMLYMQLVMARLAEADDLLRQHADGRAGRLRSATASLSPLPTPPSVEALQQVTLQHPQVCISRACRPHLVVQHNASATTLQMTMSPQYRVTQVPSLPRRVYQEWEKHEARAELEWLQRRDLMQATHIIRPAGMTVNTSNASLLPASHAREPVMYNDYPAPPPPHDPQAIAVPPVQTHRPCCTGCNPQGPPPPPPRLIEVGRLGQQRHAPSQPRLPQPGPNGNRHAEGEPHVASDAAAAAATIHVISAVMQLAASSKKVDQSDE